MRKSLLSVHRARELSTMPFTCSFIVALLVALFLTACDEAGDSASGTPTPVILASISITPGTASVAKGLTTNFTATGRYSDNTTADITSQVIWTSSNNAVATINATGVATGVSFGGVAVAATLNDISSPAATLTVTPAEVTGIAISPSSASSPKGTPVTFTAMGTFSDGTTGNISGSVTWASSNTAVATLNDSGIASTLAEGSTTITASTNNITSNSAMLTVTSPVGPFTASYYNGTTFVTSESVARPSINYAWANFNGIDSLNFHAIWTGNIEVFNTPKLIDMNFEVSWSDVSLFVDGVAIASWSNSNRTIQHEFSPGVHEIKIEYYNHWHTTGFDVSFTTNTMYSKADAISVIAPHIDANTKIIYVGAYESADLYKNSTVTLNGTPSKVFLFLSSYGSLNWIINNPYNVTITGIAYSSYSTVSTVTADNAIPTFEIAGLAYGYTDFTAPSADITYLIGRAPDYKSGAYGLTEAIISVP